MEELGTLPVVRSREEVKIDYIVNWVKTTNADKDKVLEYAWNYCLDNRLLAYWPIIAERIMDLS